MQKSLSQIAVLALLFGLVSAGETASLPSKSELFAEEAMAARAVGATRYLLAPYSNLRRKISPGIQREVSRAITPPESLRSDAPASHDALDVFLDAASRDGRRNYRLPPPLRMPDAPDGETPFADVVGRAMPNHEGVVILNGHYREGRMAIHRSLAEKIREILVLQSLDFGIEAALREAIRNALIHGNQMRPGNILLVRWRREAKKFVVDVIDQGTKPIDYSVQSDLPLIFKNRRTAGVGHNHYIRFLDPHHRSLPARYDFPLLDRNGNRIGQIVRLIFEARTDLPSRQPTRRRLWRTAA